jgi:spore maturation protein CgeB
MSSHYRIAFFGSSLVSSYWNGAATYYRGVLRALGERGHKITFYEPDAFQRQQHRDMDDPPWAKVEVYPASEAGVARALEQAAGVDIVVKASGVGVFDELLEREVLNVTRSGAGAAIFWDVDAPATLQRVRENAADPFRELIPRYDFILTYGGGPPVVEAYRSLGAADCIPIYNAFDQETHHPAPPDPRFAGDLAFLGNRLPDREARVQEFFLHPATRLPGRRFVLGGSGWGENVAITPNVNYVGHVYTHEHNAFNATPLAVLNINRQSMADVGFSPPTRVFEAAGAGACLISDSWPGIEQFLEPEREVLIAADGEEVIEQLERLTRDRAREIGAAARRRVLAHHTYEDRATQVEAVFRDRLVAANRA